MLLLCFACLLTHSLAHFSILSVFAPEKDYTRWLKSVVCFVSYVLFFFEACIHIIALLLLVNINVSLA